MVSSHKDTKRLKDVIFHPVNAAVRRPRHYAIVPLLLFTAVLSGCGKKREQVHRAFYEWRSRVSYSPADLAALDSLNVARLYVRFFDVQWSDERDEPYPESIARFDSTFPRGIAVVPTIYITNDVMKRVTDDRELAELATNVRRKIDAMARSAGEISFDEVQIDCDWTATSRVQYFEFLRQVKEEFPEKTISATIRLHQIRYRVETGIPPVDRGMLIAYNVGNVTSPDETNSIFSADEVAKYLGDLDEYPLPLDAALPAFSWGVRFHFNRFTALIDNVTAADMQGRTEFRRIGENLWQALRETTLREEPVYPGDAIRIEEPSREEVLEIARSIADDLDEPSLTVALYRFNPEIVGRHGPERFREVFGAFE